MPLQLLLPGMSDGATRLGSELSILKKEGRVTYFVGAENWFSHREGDRSSYRYALAMFMENGHVRPREVRAALGIPRRTLMHWGKQFREKGADSFFRPVRHGGAPVMTPQKVRDCEALLAVEPCVAAAARQAGVGASTLRKALKRGAVRRLAAPESCVGGTAVAAGTTKSARSRLDAQAASGMGTACTRADERVAAAMGLAGSAVARFEAVEDVALGGLLAGLPALCANGILSGLGKYVHLPKGFYSCLHILVTLGFMALGRIRRPEGLRQVPPGELGKVVGLDRVPEVRTLREKITLMAQTGDPQAWMLELAKSWMEAEPEHAGYCYVDGHVRVYYGDAARLTPRYVSRQRLCLRGTTDYWVNDALGRPFFVVSKSVTEGIGATLLDEIVPILLKTVPGQPTEAELEADPLLHRFVVIVDREGSYPKWLSELWKHRIGVITYRKNVEDRWPENEFTKTEVPTPAGARTSMMLALRETQYASKDVSVPVTEVRRLTANGHQTAIICSARKLANTVVAGRMFARWCQENFFAYGMQHFDLDGLVQYGAEPLPGTTQVVNPARRNLEKDVRKARTLLRGLQAKLGAQADPDDGLTVQNSAQLFEEIQGAQTELDRLCTQRKTTPKKVPLASLPEDQRPSRLPPLNKTLIDTVKMIAYRAETALMAALLPHLKKEDEARALIRELFVSSADIQPDQDTQTVTVRIHRMACPAHDKAITALLEDLTQLEFRHPETGQRIIYTLA